MSSNSKNKHQNQLHMKKTIKSLILCIILGTASTYLHAEKRVRIGVKGGVNASTTSVSLSKYSQEHYLQNNTEYKYNAGFNAGILVEFPINKMLSLQPEMNFTTKGMRNESHVARNISSTSGTGTERLHAVSKISSHYIELPLYIKYALNITRLDKFIAGAGPYFAYGISGKMKSEFTLSTSSIHWKGEKDIFKGDDMHFNENRWTDHSSVLGNAANLIREPYWRKPLKRFDGGVSGFVGYEFQEKWFATISYDVGLINSLNAAEAWDGKVDGKMYNRTFSLSLGYKF